MDYLSGISRKFLAFFSVFVLDHAKDVGQLCASLLARFHLARSKQEGPEFPPPKIHFPADREYLVVFKFHDAPTL